MLYAGRPGDSLTRENSIVLVHKKNTAFAQVDGVSLVKEMASVGKSWLEDRKTDVLYVFD